MSKNEEVGATIGGTKVYTVNEAANILNVTGQTVRVYVKSGKLKGSNIGGVFLVTDEAVREFKEQNK